MPTDLSESVFTLPDILVEWPWKRKVNPHSGLQALRAESSTWIQSFIELTPRMQRVFDLGNFYLLSSLAYPLENKDVFRVGCNLMGWFFLFDEYSDVASPHETQQMATITMDAIRNPDKARAAGEYIVGEAIRQVFNLLSKYASIGAHRRFIEALDRFTASVVQQAQDRAQDYVRTVDECFHIRRDTIGARPAFIVLEFGLNLPDEVFEDPVIERLTNVCIDLITLSNDICSYNVEQARGDDGHNLVTILMHHENLGLNEAMRWIGDYCLKLVHNFLDDLNHVPSFGKEFDGDVKRYLDGLGNWVRANDCWNFESRKYFLTDGLEIQQSRKVVLLPRTSF